MGSKCTMNCRYLSSCEATWRIFVFDTHYREPAVERLSFHLPGQLVVMYGEDATIEYVVCKPKNNTSKFLAWMNANKIYLEGKSILYAQFLF